MRVVLHTSPVRPSPVPFSSASRVSKKNFFSFSSMHNLSGMHRAGLQEKSTDPLIAWENLDPLAGLLPLVLANLRPEAVQ